MKRRETHAIAHFELVWQGSRSELLAHGLDVAGVRGLDNGGLPRPIRLLLLVAERI